MGIQRSVMRTTLPGSSGENVSVPQKYAAYLDDTVRNIVQRGNDVEIRSSKDGIKVLEVKKTVAAVIPMNPCE